jgi:hypothetical protein
MPFFRKPESCMKSGDVLLIKWFFLASGFGNNLRAAQRAAVKTDIITILRRITMVLFKYDPAWEHRGLQFQ